LEKDQLFIFINHSLSILHYRDREANRSIFKDPALSLFIAQRWGPLFEKFAQHWYKWWKEKQGNRSVFPVVETASKFRAVSL